MGRKRTSNDADLVQTPRSRRYNRGKDIHKAPAEEHGLVSYCAYRDRAWDSLLLLVFSFFLWYYRRSCSPCLGIGNLVHHLMHDLIHDLIHHLMHDLELLIQKFHEIPKYRNLFL